MSVIPIRYEMDRPHTTGKDSAGGDSHTDGCRLGDGVSPADARPRSRGAQQDGGVGRGYALAQHRRREHRPQSGVARDRREPHHPRHRAQPAGEGADGA